VHQFVTREIFVDVGAKNSGSCVQTLFRGLALVLIIRIDPASSSYGLMWNGSSIAV
jgi:hypothetical protein